MKNNNNDSYNDPPEIQDALDKVSARAAGYLKKPSEKELDEVFGVDEQDPPEPAQTSQTNAQPSQPSQPSQRAKTNAQRAPASEGDSPHAGGSMKQRARESQKQREECSRRPIAYDGYGNIIYGNTPAPAPEAVDDEKPLLLPILKRADQIPDKPINFLWKDRFSYQFGLLAGRQGLGKSMFVCYMAAQITNAGVDRWDDGAPCPTGSVIFFTPEGGEYLTKQRIRNMGGNFENLFFYSGLGQGRLRPDNKTIDTDIAPVVSDIQNLTQMIDAAEKKVHLIIIDPITDFMGDTKQNDNAEVTRALRGLDYLAVEKNICIIGVKHLNKTANTSAAVYSVGGAGAFTSKPRFVYLLDQHPESRKAELMGGSSTEKNLLLVPAKQNDFIIKNSIEFYLSGGEDNFHVEITDLSGDWTGDSLQYELAQINGATSKGRGRPANDERNAKIEEMIQNNASNEEIIKETGASLSTIRRARKKIEADILSENILNWGGNDEQEETTS
ncbi:MAG: AAA family ATPase [Thermoguttaceae bacterium]|nr:AAA family ATPase [Thermoguttaceae bacterium]